MQERFKGLTNLKKTRLMEPVLCFDKRTSVSLSVRRAFTFIRLPALLRLFPILVFASLSACLPSLSNPDSEETLFHPSLLCNLTGDCAAHNGLSTPAFTPAAGLYNSSQNVTISSASSGVLLCYTTDGSDPTCDTTPTCTTGAAYAAAIPVPATTTLKAIACKAETASSAIRTGLYTIDTTAPGAVAPLNAVAGDTQINLSWTNPADADLAGVRLLRKIGGFSVDENDGTVVYNGLSTTAVNTGLVNGTTYYYTAFAYDTAGNFSTGTQASATPMAGTANAPSYTPAAGLFNAAQNVAISSTTASVTICYTTDGSAPACDATATCTNGSAYGGPVAVSATTTLRALACRVGYFNSGISDGTFSIDVTAPGNAASFVATPGNGYVDLSWTNPGDADLAGVRILRKTGGYPTDANDAGATIVHSGPGTSATDSGLTNGTQYYYAAYAYDTAGNFASGVQDTATPDIPPGTGLWARTVTGGGGDSEFTAVVFDPVSNAIYAAGYIKGSGVFDFGNGVTLSGYSATGSHPVIVKYALDGSALWARTIASGPTMTSARYQAVAVNSSGEVFAAGMIQQTSPVDFGGVSATGIVAGTTAVLVKYDSSGTVLWARTPISGTQSTSFDAITIDASDNIILTGNQQSTSAVDYGAGVIISGGTTNGNTLVVKYDNTGMPLWGRTTLSGMTANQSRGIAVDPMTGDIYVAGSQQDTGAYDYGGGVTLTGLYTTFNLFVLRYDAAGSIQWGRTTVAGLQNTIFFGVAVDASGNACAVGQQTNTITYDFGGITSTGAGTGANSALVCYNSSGVPLWARTTTVAGGSSSPFKSVTIDSAGNILTAGYQYGSGSYSYGAGASATGSYIGYNPNLVKYDSAGTPLWARSTIVGANSSQFYSVTTDGTNHVYAVGAQTGATGYTYSPGVTATGDHTGVNAVIVKYSP
ncbi:MAG: hypothetical protein F9K24_15375 [Leptonema illini]|uniref:Fibronectin type-III domain-containing protein n=1 Tax=Leptonema illini TaxID=183 RepID=A0A833LXF2_9LEPT|nr:MAG: hypothetical protein F9K24_15375 [Leptonema illini]